MRFKVSILILALSLTALTVVFFTGKWIKKRWIVHATLTSRHWRERDAEIRAVDAGRYKVILLGNSLTELFYLDQYFRRRDMLNCGIVGDFSEGLVRRIDAISKLQPEKLFIEIGINDIVEGISLKEICANYRTVIFRVKAASPRTQIYIQSNLPLIIRNPSIFVTDRYVNDRVKEQNVNLSRLASELGVTFIDLYTPMSKSGPLEQLVVADGIHLTDKAYRIWANTIAPFVYSDNLR